MASRDDGTLLSPVINRGVLCAGIVALAFYCLGISWGVPYASGPDGVKAWGIDDESPLGPLAEIHNILHPKPNQWLSYPLLYSFLAAAAYAPYMLWLFATGGLSGISATYPFGLSDPVTSLRTLTLIAHSVSAIMGAVVVCAAYDIGRTLINERMAAYYAALVTVSFPLFYYARNGNVDATAMAFTGLTCAAFCRAATDGLNRHRTLWLGAFAGLALAAKESSVGVLLVIPLILLWTERRRGVLPRKTMMRLAALGVGAALLAFGCGSGLFVDPKRYFAHVRYLRELLALVSAADTPSVFTFPYTWSGNIGYLSATLANAEAALTEYGIVLLLTGVTCAFAMRSKAAFPALLAVSYAVYLFATYRLVQIRYLMPFLFLALFYVAYAVGLAARSKALAPKVIGLALGVLTLGRTALTAVEYTYQMRHDSRHDAATWLSKNTRAGDTVAYFAAASVLPAIPAGVKIQLAAEYRNMYVRHRIDDAKAREIREFWRQTNPACVLIMPDHTSPPNVPYSVTVPPQLYADLLAGDNGYTLAAAFQTAPLLPWIDIPKLDYPVVNPPIRIFAPVTQVSSESR